MLLLTLVSCALITDAQYMDRMDMDGDGVPRPDDCDDTERTIGAARTWFVDEDRDGYGSTSELTDCDPAGGVAEVSGDCDDANPTTFPGAEEACNYEDDDCDGVADDGVEPPTWYFDGDRDGYGTGATTNVGCEAPEGYVSESGDCNDSDASLNPETPWYPDADGDTYGDSALPSASCDAPAGLLRDGTDCNDADPAIHPGAQEVCDDADADEDCNGLADDEDPGVLEDGQSTFYQDSDGDGYGDASQLVEACDASMGLVTDGRDCDDSTTTSGIECGWIDVSTGRTVACGVRGSGLVSCWGEDPYGYGLLSPPAGAFAAVVADDAGSAACGLRVDGTLECWGNLTYASPPSGTFTAISGGMDFCALGTDQSVQCWGPYSDVAGREPPGPQASIASAAYAAVALNADGLATSWGNPLYGTIDLPNTDYTAVSAGAYWICGLRADGSADCVGEDLPVALYVASEDDEETYPGPYAAVVPGDSQITFLDDSGTATLLAVSNAGEAELIPTGERWLVIEYGYFYGCGIAVDGALWCWGDDSMGEGQTTPPE